MGDNSNDGDGRLEIFEIRNPTHQVSNQQGGVKSPSEVDDIHRLGPNYSDETPDAFRRRLEEIILRHEESGRQFLGDPQWAKHDEDFVLLCDDIRNRIAQVSTQSTETWEELKHCIGTAMNQAELANDQAIQEAQNRKRASLH